MVTTARPTVSNGAGVFLARRAARAGARRDSASLFAAVTNMAGIPACRCKSARIIPQILVRFNGSFLGGNGSIVNLEGFVFLIL